MGEFEHHAIIVTCYDIKEAEKAHKKATELFDNQHFDYSNIVSEIINSAVNAFSTFFIGPDGSKEFWDTSNNYNNKRKEFIDWLKKETKSSFVDYIEISYSSTLGDPPEIINHS